ncbi:transglutaminase family protein [Kineococcus gypseus]|uniref:transglutaminase domain-containing protein n=1 Tax=Kineococcus gypseus TaxID=1637102 RepID=UPI003D7E673D
MTTRRLHIGCEFVHRATMDTPSVVQVRPRSDQPVTLIEERWSTEPEQSRRSYTDLYGNDCQRLVIPEGRSAFRYDAVAEVPDAVEDADEDAPELFAQDLPDDVLVYTLPSRYVVPDVLAAEAWVLFSKLPRGYTRVRAICDHVHQHLRFQYGSTTSLSTAADVYASGYGVCRDFTHLAITFCRALSIPARYVFGYLPEIEVDGPPVVPDFAAWMEVWLGDRWWTFDPRNNARRKGRVLIGRGRDASDVAMLTTFGAPVLESMTVRAEEVR